MKAKQKNVLENTIPVFAGSYMIIVFLIGMALSNPGNYLGGNAVSRNIAFYNICVINTYKVFFIIDSIFSKNLFQVKSYFFIIIFSIITYCLCITEAIIAVNIPLSNITYYILIIISLLIEFGFYIYKLKDFIKEYEWLYFKRIGSNYLLTDAYKLRQQSIVIFKMFCFNVLYSFSSLLDGSSLSVGLILIVLAEIVLSLIIIFINSVFRYEESKFIRYCEFFILITILLLQIIDVFDFSLNFDSNRAQKM
ncbi:hypothetical protein LUQ84_3561 [Hamiltosporidium tvaerminnensis]|nr:hypothetical protein LUQ84_3561 [Hamiltosporidium tvaerminnensis]